MSLQKLVFKPGVNRDQTNYTNEGGWYECDKIRFRSGMPQKLGGWLKTTLTPMAGVCRQMFNWVTSYNDNLLAAGTNKKVYIEVGNQLYDITPLRATDPTFTTPDTDNCFTTTNGSSTITVVITNCDPTEGNYVDFTGATDVGGIPAALLNTTHEIQTAINVDAFTIEVSANATSAATGGGTAINASFEIDTGYEITTAGYGWGTGGWGIAAWGLGSVTPIFLPQQDWFFDNFDNDLVMNIRNGPIYYWERGVTTVGAALANRAVLLSDTTIDGIAAADVPDEAMQTMVSQGDKHLLAFGATPFGGGEFDPLLIRWSDQDQPNYWTPSITNSAGFLRVPRGSRIVRAVPTRQETIVFTDSSMYSLQFLGTTDVFALQELSDNISIAGPRSAVAVNNVVYWMGTDKFYAYSGRVETLPCTLRNHVFSNINFEQMDQIVCGTNEGWHEIWWFYPTADSNTNNAYVVYNYLERVWFYGSLERTAWNDSPLRPYPQAVTGGYIYNHEQGTNDDLLPMTSYITSSDFDISEGEQFMLMYRIIPDIDFTGSTLENPEVTMYIKPHYTPGSAYQTPRTGRVIESTVGQYTSQVYIRARARQLGFKIQSTDLDTQWQLGSPRIDARVDGKR